MENIAEIPAQACAMPRFEDGAINLQELIRRLAEDVANGIMDAEADQMREATGNSRNGHRTRTLKTCVGELSLRVPKLHTGSFFPEDVITRYRRVDRALAAAVAEMYATGMSTRKVQRVAERMGVSRLSKDQVSAIARDLSGSKVPYVWLDATYVKCRREGRVASTAVVTAIGCDEGGWRRVLGVSVVDTESYDSWLSFLRAVRARGVEGVRLVVSDAHPGLVRALGEVFQGAAWLRCVVRLMRDCMREAGSRPLRARVGRILSPVFRGKDAPAVAAMYHVAVEMLESCCPKAARVLEEAEPDALGYLDFPQGHWKRLRANNLQERTSREIKRRSRAVQVFPSVASLERLAGAIMCEQDDLWADSRYFSEARMRDLGEPKAPAARDARGGAELLEFARRAIESSLELADRVEAA